MWSYRLRRVYRGLAVPGWVVGLWGIIEQASVVSWLRDVWIALSPKLAAVSGYGAVLSVVGFGWLVWVVVRKPRTIDLQEFAKARGERGLMLKNETITDRVIEGPATVWVGDGTVLKDNSFEGTSY